MDIDVDLAPSKRPLIFERIREERGELGMAQVATFGTMSSKAAVKAACRGLGIELSEAEYLASLIPSERGFLWPIEDVVNGNEEKERKPVAQFVSAANKHPGLLDVIKAIEGTISQRGVHASGVNFYDDDPYETACFMMAPDGKTITTQYSLHDCEAAGDTKFDFLVTVQMDIMTDCLNLLRESGHIDPSLSLREAYNRYLHPDVLDLTDQEVWDAFQTGTIMHLFQFEGEVGVNALHHMRPHSIHELTMINGVMRLVSPEKGGETPSERYERMMGDMSQWYDEMRQYGLTEEEQHALEPYYLKSYGMPGSQEDLMTIIMDPKVCGLTLKESNAIRKICSKKIMSKIEWAHQEIVSRATSEAIGRYVWDTCIRPQLSYSFATPHGTAYSMIAFQSVYLATKYPSIYWNTACMRVDSGLGDDDGTRYDKIAKAIGEMRAVGVTVSTLDINKSGYMFAPDEAGNRILYGLKAVNGINAALINDIIAGRPYTSFADFYERVSPNKTMTLALIKGGAFDQFAPRGDVMREYLTMANPPKKRVTLQNVPGLMEHGLVPKEFEFQTRLFRFNKALRAHKYDRESGTYTIERNYYDFYERFFPVDRLKPRGGTLVISEKDWKKLYTNGMAPLGQYLKDNQDDVLKSFNEALLQDVWKDCASGTESTWEMESLGFYAGPHELRDIDLPSNGLVRFKDLPADGNVERMVKHDGREFPIHRISRIVGTVLSKNAMKSMVTVLTNDGEVVSVKFNRIDFANYNRRVTEDGSDGTSHVVDPSWFDRGTLLLICGYRREGMFVAKAYSRTRWPLLFKITESDGYGKRIVGVGWRSDEYEALK